MQYISIDFETVHRVLRHVRSLYTVDVSSRRCNVVNSRWIVKVHVGIVNFKMPSCGGPWKKPQGYGYPGHTRIPA